MAGKNEAKIKFKAETTEFNESLKKAGNTIGELIAEFKLNEAQMEKNGVSIEGLENKHRILTAQLEATQDKTAALNDKLASAISIYGENSTEASNLRKQLLNAQTAEEKIRKAIDDCNREIDEQKNAMQDAGKEMQDASKEMRDVGKATETVSQKVSRQEDELKDLKKAYADVATENGKSSKEAKGLAKEITVLSKDLKKSEKKLQKAADKADKLDKSFEKASGSTGKLKNVLGKIGPVARGIGTGVGVAAGTIGAIGGAFLGTAEATREYRTEMGKLQSAFDSANLGGEAAGDTYKSLYSIIGETDQSVEAAQQIALLANNTEDAAKYADLAAGVVGRFGDALQPETFYESANETLKLGEATGAFTQMLEGTGMSVEKFNKGLKACNTEEEKSAYLLSVTEQALGTAGEAYKATNEDIINSNLATESFNEALSFIGASAEPVMTSVKNIGAGILTDLSPSVALIGEGLVGAMNGAEGSAEQFGAGVGGVLDTVVTNVTAAIPMVAQAIPSLITSLVDSLAQNSPAIVDGFVMAFNGIVAALPQVIESIVAALPVLLPALVNGLVSMVNAILLNLPLIIQPLISYLPQIITSVVTALTTNLPVLIDGLINLVMAIIPMIPQIIQALVDAIPVVIPMVVTALLNEVPQLISGAIQIVGALISALPSILGGIKTAIMELFSSFFGTLGTWIYENAIVPIGEFFSGLWESVKERTVAIWNGIKTSLSNAFNKVKTTVSNVFNSVKEKISNIWNGIKTTISNVVGGIRDKISNVFNSVKTTVGTIFNSIKEKMSKPIEKARDLIKGIVEKIKGFFSGMKISFPKIKLPHFKVKPSGWSIGDLLKGSIPTLGIDWYAKGAIFKSPTIIPTASGLKGVGDAGAEAVLPIAKMEEYIENVIERTMPVVNLGALADKIEELAQRPIQMNINGRQFALATAGDTDGVNGLRNTFGSRGLVL